MSGKLVGQTVFAIGGRRRREGAHYGVMPRGSPGPRQLRHRSEVHAVDANDAAKMRMLFNVVDRIDGVFFTIGDLFPDQVLQPGLAGLESSMVSHYRSAVTMARLAGPQLRTAGSITYITGIAAWKPIGRAAAAASCAAIESMAGTLSVCLAPVRVNCIEGSIRIGMSTNCRKRPLRRC